jgi:hypothetical protein
MEQTATGQEKPKSRQAKQNPETDPLFRVDAKDYSETFDNQQAAIKQADYLKKRAVKEQAPVKITVTEVIAGKDGKVVHTVKIGESFYN